MNLKRHQVIDDNQAVCATADPNDDALVFAFKLDAIRAANDAVEDLEKPLYVVRMTPDTRVLVEDVNDDAQCFTLDGNGLALRVKRTGARSLVQRLRVHGRAVTMGLGGFPLVSLNEAREVAVENRMIARKGDDP